MRRRARLPISPSPVYVIIRAALFGSSRAHSPACRIADSRTDLQFIGVQTLKFSKNYILMLLPKLLLTKCEQMLYYFFIGKKTYILKNCINTCEGIILCLRTYAPILFV